MVYLQIGIEGKLKQLGSGKTAFLTGLGYRAYKRGYTIASNYHLNFDYIAVSTVEQLNALRDVVFLGDELWSWVRSRKGSSDLNLVVDNILLSARKRRCSVYYTQQMDTLIARSMREITPEWVETWVYGRLPRNLPSGLPAYKFVYGHFLKTGLKLRFDLPYIGSMFDTTEEVQALIKDDEFYRSKTIDLRSNSFFMKMTNVKAKIQFIINNFRMIERDAYLLLEYVASDKFRCV